MKDLGGFIQKRMERAELNQRYDQMMATVMQDSDVQIFLRENKEQVTSELITRSAAKLFEFVGENKKFKAHEPTLLPGYQPKLALTKYYIDVIYEPTAEKLQSDQSALIKSRIKSLNMPKDILNASLADFELSDESRESLIDRAVDFVDGYSRSPKTFHKGFYIQGPFGTGKTYLLGAIARELADKGFSTTLVHFPTFAVEMKNSIGDNTVLEKINLVKKTPILMIDDLGADSMSSWIRDDVLGVILQYRMQEQLTTFFTSNFNMAQLESEHLSVTQRGEVEPLKAMRLMERIRFLSSEIELKGRNRRYD